MSDSYRTISTAFAGSGAGAALLKRTEPLAKAAREAEAKLKRTAKDNRKALAIVRHICVITAEYIAEMKALSGGSVVVGKVNMILEPFNKVIVEKYNNPHVQTVASKIINAVSEARSAISKQQSVDLPTYTAIMMAMPLLASCVNTHLCIADCGAHYKGRETAAKVLGEIKKFVDSGRKEIESDYEWYAKAGKLAVAAGNLAVGNKVPFVSVV